MVDRNKFDALLHEAGVTQNELARRIDLEPHKLSKTVNGVRRLQVDELLSMARILGVSVTDLLKVLGYQGYQRTVRVVRCLREDGQVDTLAGDAGGKVEVPSTPRGIVDVVRVETTGTPHGYLHGSYIFAGAPRAPELRHINTLGLIEADGQPSRVLGVIQGGQNSKIVILNHLTKASFITSEVHLFSPVLCWHF